MNFPSTLNGLLLDIQKRNLMVRENRARRYREEVSEVLLRLMQSIDYTEPYRCSYKHKPEFDPNMFTTNTAQASSGMRVKHLRDDLEIKPHKPGTVWLQVTPEFFELSAGGGQRLDHFTHHWVDDEGYLLRSKFVRWFNDMVDQALEQLPTCGNRYLLRIENECYQIMKRAKRNGCVITVMSRGRFWYIIDMLPALGFPEQRWLKGSGYRQIPPYCKSGTWTLVPEGKVLVRSPTVKRNWKMVLKTQESFFLHYHPHLLHTMRLVNKVRKALKMTDITSYDIKTLFLWETERTDKNFWDQQVKILFKIMIERLYNAIRQKRIPFFWNEHKNMILNLQSDMCDLYEKSLAFLLQSIENADSLEDLARFMLSPLEFKKLYGRSYSGYRRQQTVLRERLNKYVFIDCV